LKDQPEAVLVRQLRQQAEGVPALSPRIARRIMEHFRYTASASDDGSVLTEREADVLGLIGRGLRNAEVAAELGLTENTVAGYIKAIYRKLDISSRAEASWHANRLGLLWKK
ncbi:MAG: DNA-binding response regulator, partial [Rhodobacteraceae bacterium]|nr:DNA-binding response regulator [Paracoccaceae bacterium]